MSVIAQYAPYSAARRVAGTTPAGRDAFGDRVVAVLETLAPGLASSVRAREVITPLDLERDYGLTGGHPLHGEQALDQFFLWRPFLGSARYRLPIDGPLPVRLRRPSGRRDHRPARPERRPRDPRRPEAPALTRRRRRPILAGTVRSGIRDVFQDMSVVGPSAIARTGGRITPIRSGVRRPMNPRSRRLALSSLSSLSSSPAAAPQPRPPSAAPIALGVHRRHRRRPCPPAVRPASTAPTELARHRYRTPAGISTARRDERGHDLQRRPGPARRLPRVG